MAFLEEIDSCGRVPFYNDTILSWDKAFPSSKQKFVVQENRKEKQTVNLSKVVGTHHQTYAGNMTWRELLNSGQRMQGPDGWISKVDKNPKLFSESSMPYHDIHYGTVDGENYYIIGEGNHRTTIAKFLFALQGVEPLLQGVTTTTYTVDWKACEAHENCLQTIERKKLKLWIQVNRQEIENGYRGSNCFMRFTVTCSTTGESRNYDKEQLINMTNFLNKASWFDKKFPPHEFRFLREAL
jgi:hypothetical protein